MSEMLETWTGRRVNIKVLDAVGEAEDVDGASKYALGVRFAPSVVLDSVSERGIVIVSTAGETDGRKFFHPWSSVLVLYLAE